MKWNEHKYGTGATINLDCGFDIVVIWKINNRDNLYQNENPYVIYINNCEYGGRFSDYDKAKKTAIKIAKAYLKKMLEKLKG